MDIAVIGLGLIGGSVLRAFSAKGHRVVGYDADPGTRALARDGGWEVGDSVADAVAGTDVAVLAVPLPAVPDVLTAVAGYTGLLTDVTSVKAPVRAHVAGSGARFVGGHPMAGRETAGFAAGDASLFEGCAWVLCLEPDETDLADWLTLATLVTALGARVVPATAAEHDAAVAAVSHVPHLLASALAAATRDDPLATTLAAGSFRVGTRVAAAPPALVASMCGGNAGPVVRALDVVLAELAAARAALDGVDPLRALEPWLAPGHAVRRGWPPRPGTPEVLPATADALLGLGRAGGWVTAVGTGTVTAVRPTR